MNLIHETTSETIQILANISAYVREGGMTWEEGEELKKQVLNNTADALNLPTMQEILQYFLNVN